MYDARGAGRGSNNGTVFGLALGGVIIAAFAAVVLWPSGGGSASVTEANASKVRVNSAFQSKEEKAFAAALVKVDDAAYQRLEQRFQSASYNETQRYEIMLEEIETVALDNIDLLAKSDVKHFNAILSDVRQGLKSASRANSKLCKGSTYASIGAMSELQAGRFLERELLSKPEIRDFGLKLNRRLLEAMAEARKKPKSYGTLDASDQMAMQRLARSLMFQPEIMSLMMMSGSTSNPEAALAKIDVCELSGAVLKAVDGLPDRTKGRIWAQALSEIKKQGSFDLDPGGLSAIGGF